MPDGDLFETISAGRASVVTDRIETFTEKGLQLESGTELEADVIVTATGLNMLMLGGMRIAVDGRDIELNETVGYKGMMLSGVPNSRWPSATRTPPGRSSATSSPSTCAGS